MIRKMYEEKFPNEFKKYVKEEKYVARERYDECYEFKHADDGVTSVDKVFQSSFSIEYFYLPPRCLIQFWRAEELVVNNVGQRPFLLNLCNQPFMIDSRLISGRANERICRYRMKMHDVIVKGDGRGGPIGRVFQNNRMEFTPDVSYYSNKEEYPQLDIAMSCDIGCSLVLPWRNYHGCVVGVIEFVIDRDSWGIPDELLSVLRSNSLHLDYCIRLCRQYDLEKDSIINAMSEINEVIGELCKKRHVVCAQTWMLCKHCNSLSTSKRCAEELEASSKYFIDDYDYFLEYQDYYNLKKSEGVVGKAAESSHNLVYCENVAELSIIEYPFAHFARSYGLSACFAICLRSYHTGDQVYVLEFFLDSIYVRDKNIRETLVPSLNIMRQVLRTFKFASGEKIGDNLSVEVIASNSLDKVERRHGESSRPSFMQQSMGESSTKETDDPMIGVETSLQHISVKDAPIASSSTVQCGIRVTIKATYGVDSIIFQLSTSSGIHELYRQVSEKLQLADGTFDLKYPDDDDDHIELTCDEDLQMYISSSMEQENYTLLVFVVPR